VADIEQPLRWLAFDGQSELVGGRQLDALEAASRIGWLTIVDP